MKPLHSILVFAFVLSGCFMRSVEAPESPLARYVGRHAEFRKRIVVYDHGVAGRLGVPAGEWPASKEEEVKMTLEPGARCEIIGVSSRLIPSGKHYYFVCRYRMAGEEVAFDYPADEKFIGADYILWR
jgi:hypothetical protein